MLFTQRKGPRVTTEITDKSIVLLCMKSVPYYPAFQSQATSKEETGWKIQAHVKIILKQTWGKLTTHLLVPRSRMRGTMPPLIHTPSWRGASLSKTYVFTP
jgi:hypothetical protein